MANNRMYLVNNRLGVSVMIAKYYPSTGWSFGSAASKIDELNKAGSSDPDRSFASACDWEIRYEDVADATSDRALVTETSPTG